MQLRLTQVPPKGVFKWTSQNPAHNKNEPIAADVYDHLFDGLGHIAEIADAEPPHTPRGCPFQAWSIGEYIRLESIAPR